MTAAPPIERAILPQVAFVLLVLAIGKSPAASLLNVAYVPMVVLMGFWLIFTRPLGYIGFVLWIWMLTPLVRRLVDFASGYHPVSFVMIAPLAVTLLSILPLFKYRRQLPQAIILPFIVITLVLIYGFFIGATSAGLSAAVFALVNWVTPLIFAIYLLWSRESAAQKSKSIFHAFLYGGTAVGLYGIFQFFYLPDWDEYWMRASKLESIGLPQPLLVRVFSTLNAPAVLALFMESTILIAIAAPGLRTKIQALPGIIVFLLSLVRSAWGGFALGFITLVWRADRTKRLWYISGLTALALTLLPVLASSAVGGALSYRTESLSNLSSDDSFVARLNIYRGFSNSSISAVFGLGLGNTGDVSSRLGTANQSSASNVIDSGLLEIISNFGVFGIFLLLGIGSLMLRAFAATHHHPSALTAAVVALAAASQILLANPFFGPSAMCFYPFLALALLFGVERVGADQRPPQSTNFPRGLQGRYAMSTRDIR